MSESFQPPDTDLVFDPADRAHQWMKDFTYGTREDRHDAINKDAQERYKYSSLLGRWAHERFDTSLLWPQELRRKDLADRLLAQHEATAGQILDYRINAEAILRDRRAIDYLDDSIMGLDYVAKELEAGRPHPWRHGMEALNRYASLPQLHPRGASYLAEGHSRLMHHLSVDSSVTAALLEAHVKMAFRYRGEISFVLLGNKAFEFSSMFSRGIYDGVDFYRQYAGDVLQRPHRCYLPILKHSQMVGMRDRNAFQAAQQVALGDPSFIRGAKFIHEDERYYPKLSDFYRPMVLQTDLVEEHPEVNVLFGILADLTEKDETLCKMLWRCVPASRRSEIFEANKFDGKRARSRRYDQLNDQERHIVRQNIGYVLMQVAFALYWGGRVSCHSEGEGDFNEISLYCLDNHREALKEYLPEQDVKFKELDKVPEGLPPRIRDLGIHGFTEEPYFYAVSETGKGSDDREWISLFVPKTDSVQALRRALAERMELYLPYFLTFLNNTDHDTYFPEEQQKRVLEVGIYHLLKAVSRSLETQKEFKPYIAQSGLKGLFEGKYKIDQLMENNIFAFEMHPIAPSMIALLEEAHDFRRDFYQGQVRAFGRSIKQEGALVRKNYDRLSPKRWLEAKGLEPNESMLTLMEEVDKAEKAKVFIGRGMIDELIDLRAELIERFSRLISNLPHVNHDQLIEDFESYLLSRSRFVPINVEALANAKESTIKASLSNDYSGSLAEALYSFRFNDSELASSYLIRYMMKALSTPVSQYPELAALLNNFFQKLFQVIYPDAELNLDLNQAVRNQDNI